MRTPALISLLAALALQARAELKLPAIIGDNMVLQQKQANPLWGWDTPGTGVTVKFAGQTKSATAGADGKWTVKLDPLPANANPAVLSIQGSTKRDLQNVLVGEVWICSGQSNMQWSVNASWDFELETATAKHPLIRLISVPQVGTQEPQQDFKGEWKECSPQTVGGFSAVGFFYGRVLHQVLGVPVGLINNAWGGSAAEAWVRRDVLEKDARFKGLIEGWVAREKQLASEEARLAHEKAMAAWKEKADAAKAAGQPFTQRAPQSPQATLAGNARPGNIYNGVLLPTIGYGVKGAIWYQGESNALRAIQYSKAFPLMIKDWRDRWGQGDFPFYFVQLASYAANNGNSAVGSSWGELRESQTSTLGLPHTGMAVTMDIGVSNDIHPRNKQDVGARLAAIALNNDYGMKREYSGPMYQSMQVDGNKIRLSFSHAANGFMVKDKYGYLKGFEIAGDDRRFQYAKAHIENNQVVVYNDNIANPVAVRYGWADDMPEVNLYNKEGFPASPFRTDNWKGITEEVKYTLWK